VKYMFLLRDGNNDGPPAPDTPEGAELFAAWRPVLEAMREEGVLVDCAPLTGVAAATTVRVRDGETLVTDGPAAELKEQVGGYTLIEVASLDEALEWAARIPTAAVGSVEVRPIIDTSAGASVSSDATAGAR
jgi:hypothetical protein